MQLRKHASVFKIETKIQSLRSVLYKQLDWMKYTKKDTHTCTCTCNNLLLMLQDAPKHNFSMNLWSSGQPKNNAKTLFSTPHPLSPAIFATATAVAFVLLRNSWYNFHCYTQHESTPTQKSARKWCCDLLRLLCAKDYKGHSLVQTSFTEPPNSQGGFEPREHWGVSECGVWGGGENKVHTHDWLSQTGTHTGWWLQATLAGSNCMLMASWNNCGLL